MMRSLYSGVAGLKTHQTKMDVIGNNIANVNTVAFKSSTVTFSDIMYQTTQGASGPNALTGTGGINAKQIGLGVSMASTMTNIKQAGATQTTGGAFDVKINGDSFFVVSDGTSNLFTRAGSFYIDAAGNLAMTSTGYNVMGWQVDPTTGEIKKDTVSALRIMQAKNLTSPPEATVKAICSGVLDANAKATTTDDGYIMNLNFYDSLGYQYTAKFRTVENGEKGVYNVSLTDILDSNGKSILTGVVTAGDLFGAPDTKSFDTGALLAGRTYHQEKYTDYMATAQPGKNPTITVLDEEGNPSTTVTSDMMKVSYLTDSGDKLIDGSTVYVYQNDKGEMSFYAADATYDSNGDVTDITFVPLSCNKDQYENIVSLEKTHLKEYFAENYSGINSGIYIDGNSYMTNETKYYDVLTLNGNDFKTVSPYRISGDGGNPQKYTITDEVTGKQLVNAKDGSTQFLVSELGYYLKNPDYFSTEMTQTGIDDLLKTNPAGTISADNYDTYMAGLMGTTYYSQLKFDIGDGTFVSIGNADTAVLALANLGPNFENIEIDFTQVTNFNNGGSSTMGMDRGGVDGSTGAGKKLGALTGVSIDTNGMIYGSYDNGNTVLLGQIAVATFANASGLQKVGDNCYQTTLNSGEFDGIGMDITADGGSMTTGALEMSNVDLSNEFTDMITTQRGFQANSRIITTSDTLLEELINLKR